MPITVTHSTPADGTFSAAGQAAQEFAKVAEYQKPIEIMTLSEIDAEIGALMRKKYRDRDDEEMLMLLMLVAQVI